MIYSVVFCFVSNGAVVGSRLSRVKFPNNSVWSTMKIAAVAYWKASSIWISANKSTPDCGWSTKNKNSSTCLMWKRHDERIIWPPNRKQTWSTGWTLYARCAICRIWPNNRQPARIHVNVSQSKFFNKLWFDLLFARYNNLSLSLFLFADYNVGADAITNQPHATTMSLNRRELALAGPSGSMDMKPSPDLIQSARLSLHRAQENSALYQNFEAPLRQPGYTMRETMVCETSLAMPSHAPPPILSQKEEYYNFPAIAEANLMRTFERSHSLRTAGGSGDTDTIGTNVMPSHGRTQSLVDQKSNLPAFGRKIPESLKLIERGTRRESELSPALSTSSGPYIAISECISGHPLSDKEPPPTPLNSLDPKFYETPRNHINIGLNLTATEQPYSPKRNNGPVVSCMILVIAIDWPYNDDDSLLFRPTANTAAADTKWTFDAYRLRKCFRVRRRGLGSAHTDRGHNWLVEYIDFSM